MHMHVCPIPVRKMARSQTRLYGKPALSDTLVHRSILGYGEFHQPGKPDDRYAILLKSASLELSLIRMDMRSYTRNVIRRATATKKIRPWTSPGVKRSC